LFSGRTQSLALVDLITRQRLSRTNVSESACSGQAALVGLQRDDIHFAPKRQFPFRKNAHGSFLPAKAVSKLKEWDGRDGLTLGSRMGERAVVTGSTGTSFEEPTRNMR
jgi:hypothetical protein